MNCDRIAGGYRWLEYLSFGRALEHRREAFLRQMVDARRILVVGEGDGRFLNKLVQQNPLAIIDYVDLSGEMLTRARSRAGTDRVVYHCADALTIPLSEDEYDLIVTHFFLDCLNEEEASAFIAKAAGTLRPGARWIVSEFRDTRLWTRTIVRILYLLFHIVTGLRTHTLIDHQTLLKRKGFFLTLEETACGGLLASELWTMDTDESDL